MTLAALCLLLCALGGAAAQNNRPIIGILSVPSSSQDHRSYIAASYVKWVESGGARVVPLPYTTPLPELAATAASLNGFLYTGGGADFYDGSGALTPFGAAANVLLQAVLNASAAGERVPLWGARVRTLLQRPRRAHCVVLLLLLLLL